MNILILRSNPVAPDPRVEKIARALHQQGWRVDVLGWDRSGELPLTAQTDFGVVRRLPIRARFGSGLGNLPQLLRWQLGLFFWLLRQGRRYDAIHACDFDTILPALLLAKSWKTALIYDIFDFYAEHLRRTPAWIKSLIRRVDLWAIGKVDAVILVDENRKQQIAASNPRMLEVIYNAPEDCQPLSAETVNNEGTDNPAGLRIAYIGLLQKERGIFELLDVLQSHPRWRLDLAGFGGDEEQIRERIAGMANVRWHGRIPYESALRISAAADALIATYDPAIPNHRFSSPNKIFEAMMLARPIIVAEHTNIDAIVRRYNNGIVVPYGDRNALQVALLQLEQNPALRRKMGENGRTAYESEYGWHIMRGRLIRLYQKVVVDHSS
ncbi:MAG: glycosyltransferase family 4 protein [Bellilinea sp.]|jgi:glycosyltransferase involved in cell wall biosynthesis